MDAGAVRAGRLCVAETAMRRRAPASGPGAGPHDGRELQTGAAALSRRLLYLRDAPAVPYPAAHGPGIGYYRGFAGHPKETRRNLHRGRLGTGPKAPNRPGACACHRPQSSIPTPRPLTWPFWAWGSWGTPWRGIWRGPGTASRCTTAANPRPGNGWTNSADAGRPRRAKPPKTPAWSCAAWAMT